MHFISFLSIQYLNSFFVSFNYTCCHRLFYMNIYFCCRRTGKQYHVIGKNNQPDAVNRTVLFYIPNHVIQLKIQVCWNKPKLFKILVLIFLLFNYKNETFWFNTLNRDCIIILIRKIFNITFSCNLSCCFFFLWFL